MKRATFGSVLVFVGLLPGVLLTDGLTVSIDVPTVVSHLAGNPVIVDVPLALFVGIPTLFTLFVLAEATGHVRERKPPS
ncbi:hypothetical protein [Natrarchaeobius chitinivorans]|uniref:Uncharacterized protein n=1 Tax=Natrarchaeobius chitinivorans TaxID=1679083 RepID=A0A3N6M165_NATCH|nr:hypothetical protein [Natrarchaeobius chitinivorans]RQG95397.1 hypothetical protein EA473_07995 [Natrarchaeobius chitinivorans]